MEHISSEDHYSQSASWSANHLTGKARPTLPRVRSESDTSGRGHQLGHRRVPDHEDTSSYAHHFSSLAKTHGDQHRQHQNTYVPPASHNISPGRSQFHTSTQDATSHVRSPNNTQRLQDHTESDAGSLNVRLDQSHLSGDRNGNFSTTQTQRSTTSQKRTTDQMQGLDSTSQTESRPYKQMYSPPAQRGVPALTPGTVPPPQPGGQVRHHLSNEPISPVAIASGLPAHYGGNISSAIPDTSKQLLTSPPQSPSGNSASETPLVKQPATRAITEQQLINEVKGIYAGLVMVERKCVDIINQQTQSSKRLTDQQWKALVALHRTLLQEHHDFFSASQHPTASDNLKKLAIKYAMPARMWRHGIHAFLELLRHRLPDSMEHMLSFIYLAYSMMALLKESVPSFVETWIECLGDLARYRMAIEDVDPRDREVWSNVAKMWYNEAADKSPNVGRIQHHLAVLARPNIVEQLFYYDKALVSIVPFVNARESIMLLFDMFLKNNEAVQSRYPPAEYAFVYYNALLFTRQQPKECLKLLETLTTSIGGHMDRAGARFKLQGPQMAAALFAALLNFGDASRLWTLYTRQSDDAEAQKAGVEGQKPPTPAKTQDQRTYWQSIGPDTKVERVPYSRAIFERDSIESPEMVAALAAIMAKEVISAVSSRMGDKNIVPFMHVVLANLWDLSFVEDALPYIEACIPWAALVLFLNTLGRSGVSYANVESEQFPQSHGGHGRQLPEDFIMRGLTTTRHYYKSTFWSEPLVNEDERNIELPSHQSPRAERCLYLGVRLASLGRYLSYDPSTQSFETTTFAQSLATLYV